MTNPILSAQSVEQTFNDEYNSFPKISASIFDISSANIEKERLVKVEEIGRMMCTSTSTQSDYVTFVQVPSLISLGFELTESEMKTPNVAEIVERRTKDLAKSIHMTVEKAHADVLLNGFSTDNLYGDGQPLFSDAHPTLAAPQSNMAKNNGPLNFDRLESLLIQISTAKEKCGLPINLQPKALVVPASLLDEANEILVYAAMKGYPLKCIANPFLDSSTAWYVTTDLPKEQGLLSIWRQEPYIRYSQNDFRAVAGCRFVPTVVNWRGIFANKG